MIKSVFYNLTRRFIHRSPKIKLIYLICKKYVDTFNGENNCDIYTNGELYILKNYLKYCKEVFDIGANIGEWTKLALNVNNKIRVHCFEPSEHTFKKLMENNFPPNVCCNNFGLSSEKKKRTLYIYHDELGINSLYNRKIMSCFPKKESVQINTLDNYCIEKSIDQIDFIKIDVEGHEIEVLKGAMNLLKEQKIKIIQFEYGGTYITARVFLQDIFQYFENFNGYRFYKIFPKNIKYIEKYNESLENFQYSNYLIIQDSVRDK